MPVNCNIHPWMQAHILIQDHPYMAVSGEDGTFEIKNLPAGKQNFLFWHESGYVRNAKVGPGKTDRRLTSHYPRNQRLSRRNPNVDQVTVPNSS